MMNARTRFWTGIALAGSLWLAMLLLGGAGWEQDEALLAMIRAGEDGVLARNAAVLTKFGGWMVLSAITIVAAIYLAFTRRIRAALLLFMVFGGRLLVELMKVIVDRDRPGASPYLEALHSMSFPSGHATNAMITYLAIAILVPVRQRNRAIAVGIGLAMAIQVGWSRVALGYHWPSDIVGGWAFGLLWIMVCMRLASARPDGEPNLPSR